MTIEPRIDMGKVRIPVADDHRMQAHAVELERQSEGKWVVMTEPVHGSDPVGNLEGEVFVVHHLAIFDAVDVDRV